MACWASGVIIPRASAPAGVSSLLQPRRASPPPARVATAPAPRISISRRVHMVVPSPVAACGFAWPWSGFGLPLLFLACWLSWPLLGLLLLPLRLVLVLPLLVLLLLLFEDCCCCCCCDFLINSSRSLTIWSWILRVLSPGSWFL